MPPDSANPDDPPSRGPQFVRRADSCGHVPPLPYVSARHLPEPANPARDAVRAAAAWLREGRPVAFPTETVYGLAADARSASAVEAIFAVKGRPSHNPLIVHVTGVQMAAECIAGGMAGWPPKALALARAFWPGPLSLVVPRSAAIADIVVGGGPTVAVRCPNHPTALALLFEFGAPLVGPSANRSGRISPTCAADVFAEFGPQEQSGILTLDGGTCAAGIESTVVDATGQDVRILRRGVITADAIVQALADAFGPSAGRVLAGDHYEPAAHSGGSTAALSSPGLLASHYAPQTPSRLVEPSELVAWCAAPGPAAAVVTFEGVPIAQTGRIVRSITLPSDGAGYAKSLYRALREADSAGAAEILIADPRELASSGEAGLWLAILDRLTRACA